MNRPLPALSAALIALAGCSAGEDDTGPGSAPTADPIETASTLPEAPDGTDYDACFDGSCRVIVTEPVDIPLDPELGTQATMVSVTEFDGWTLAIAFSDNGQELTSVTWDDMREEEVGPMWTTSDGARIEVVGSAEGQAVIAITTPGPGAER